VKRVAPFFLGFALEPELAPDRVRLVWQQVVVLPAAVRQTELVPPLGSAGTATG
jgi:hypothetical protein